MQIRRHLPLPLLAALCLALAACGTAETGAVQETVPSVQATPAATSAPVDQPTAEPTAEPTADTEPSEPAASALPPGHGPDGNEEEEYGEGHDAEGFGPDGNEEELYGEGIDADDSSPGYERPEG